MLVITKRRNNSALFDSQSLSGASMFSKDPFDQERHQYVFVPFTGSCERRLI